MNKKEISEIKKTLTNDRCCLERIAGCYVSGDKTKVLTFNESFLSLPEEEIFKYFTLFRKILSGKVGDKLINLKVLNKAEAAGEPQAKLLNLRDDMNDNELQSFYTKVINAFNYPENYLILLIKGTYDVPGKAMDGTTLEDSTYLYSHIMCAICPVNLEKEGLCYSNKSNKIKNIERDWIVGEPINGFLFPAFNDRSADIHEALYYIKNVKEARSGLTAEVLGCEMPLTSKEQKEAFNAIIADTFDNDCNVETAKSIYENLLEISYEHKEDCEPYSLSKKDIKKAIEQSGASKGQVARFEESYDTLMGTSEFQIDIAIDNAKLNIKGPDVSIKMNSDRTDLVEMKQIDGENVLVVHLNGEVDINGLICK